MTKIHFPVTGIVNEATGRTVEIVPALIARDGLTAEEVGERFDTAMRALAAIGIDLVRIVHGAADAGELDPVTRAEIEKAARAREDLDRARQAAAVAEANQARERYAVASALALAAWRVRKGAPS